MGPAPAGLWHLRCAPGSSPQRGFGLLPHVSRLGKGFMLSAFLLTRKMYLMHNIGLLLQRMVIKGNPSVLQRKVTLSHGNCPHITDVILSCWFDFLSLTICTETFCSCPHSLMKKFQQISDFYSVSLKNQETHKVVI